MHPPPSIGVMGLAFQAFFPPVRPKIGKPGFPVGSQAESSHDDRRTGLKDRRLVHRDRGSAAAGKGQRALASRAAAIALVTSATGAMPSMVTTLPCLW